MIYLLAFIIIYILSAWRVWWFLRMAHYHPKGKWNRSDPATDDYWSTFCPLLNTIYCVSILTESWKREQYTKNNNNIFKPKKPLI